MTEIEESAGVVSSMRVTLRGARRAGYVMIGSGIILTALMIILSRGYETVPVVTILVGGGAGMITGTSWAKAVQAKGEEPETKRLSTPPEGY